MGQEPLVCRAFTNWRGLPNIGTWDILKGIVCHVVAQHSRLTPSRPDARALLLTRRGQRDGQPALHLLDHQPGQPLDRKRRCGKRWPGLLVRAKAPRPELPARDQPGREPQVRRLGHLRRQRRALQQLPCRNHDLRIRIPRSARHRLAQYQMLVPL